MQDIATPATSRARTEMRRLARLNGLLEADERTDVQQWDAPGVYTGPTPRAWQLEALAAWCRSGRRGVVEAVTGTGKTVVGVLAAAEALADRRQVVVLVPGIDLQEQWVRVLGGQLRDVEVGSLGGGRHDSLATHRIVVATVQSATALAPRPGALLIADEVHRYGTPAFTESLLPAFHQRLGLTATYERADQGIARYLRPYFGEVVAGCDYRRGLDDEILADFRVGFIGVDLTDAEQVDYDGFQDVLASARASLVAGHGCPPRPFGEFIKAVQRLATSSFDDAGTRVARRYMAAFGGRRALVAECQSKRAVVEGLAEVLHRAGRGLVFAETVTSAEAVAKILSSRDLTAAAYTSRLTRTARKHLMQSFTRGDVRVLAAPRVLDEASTSLRLTSG